MRSIQRFTALIILIVAAIVTAGQLSPPAGPVAPTMKSLADLSAEHAAIQAAIGSGGGGGGAPIKRVIRGTLSFAAGSHQAQASIDPPLDPAKSIILPITPVFTSHTGTPTDLHARSGVCAELTANELSVTLDAQTGMNRKLSYQIVEYY